MDKDTSVGTQDVNYMAACSSQVPLGGVYKLIWKRYRHFDVSLEPPTSPHNVFDIEGCGSQDAFFFVLFSTSENVTSPNPLAKFLVNMLFFKMED